jgi:transposase
MVIADQNGLPLAIEIAEASPHETTLVERTLEAQFIDEQPQRLVGDKAYDSDPLDEQLKKRGIEMIAPHRENRTKPRTQDGRPLRRRKRRWRVERLFAWMYNYRKTVTRWEYHAINFLGFVKLCFIIILLKQYL